MKVKIPKLIKYVSILLAFSFLFFHTFLDDGFVWVTRLSLSVFLEIEPFPNQINLVVGKLRTLSRIFSLFFLIVVFRYTIASRLRALHQLDGIGSCALAFCFLAIPGVVFYFTGVKTLLITNIPLILSGLLSTLLLEFFFLIVLFYAASLVSFYRGTTAIVLVFAYVFIVGALTALVKASGEMDYLKYVEMIWGADYNYLLQLKIILPVALYLSPTALIAVWLQRKLTKYRLSCKEVTLACVAVVLFLATNPVVTMGEILALPFRSLNTSFYMTEASNVDSLVGGHFPRLLSSATHDLNYMSLAEVPQDLEALSRQFGLFQPSTPLSQGEDYASFKRIILLTVESLSLDFTGFEQPPCSETITPRIDALMSTYPSGALWTNASPTLYGLSAMFSGHPNAKMVIEMGYPNSFVRALRDSGYRTILIRSAPETYANEHIYFRKAGFQEIYGRNFFRDEMKLSDHISGWGLEDAYLYRYSIDFLKQNQEGNLFVHILPADTHTPYGRDSYSNDYPDLLDEMSCEIDNERLLRSFYRQDFDIGRFYDALVRENLLDDETLFIVTADHSSPRYYNPEPEILERVPIVFISKEKIESLELNQAAISQVDLAPTVLELAGVKPPWGYFGQSLLRKAEHSYFGIHGEVLTIRTKGQVKKILISEPQSQEESNLVRLLQTIFTKGAE